MYILLHNCLDLVTFNTKDLIWLIPWLIRKSWGKFELVHAHNSYFNETMHYWPDIIRISSLVHFCVTERFSITCIFYREKNNCISSAYNLLGMLCVLKLNMVTILPWNHNVKLSGILKKQQTLSSLFTFIHFISISDYFRERKLHCIF